MSDIEILRQLEGSDADLHQWADRGTRMPPEQPQPRSQLADDDRIFRPYPISEIARYSLLSAGEHLRLARLAIEARQLYPSAHSTVLRSALVGAAQGVWIVAPDQREIRQQHGLAVLSEILKQHAAYDREVVRSAQEPADRAELERHLNHLELRMAQAAAVRTSRGQLNQTDMIASALDLTFSGALQRRAGRELWRQLSGDAHVLAWPAFGRGPVTDVNKTTGLGVIASAGQLEIIAEPYLCAYRLLKHGWVSFDRRCEAP